MQNSNCPKFEACVWLYATYDIVWLCYKLCRCTEKLNVYMGECIHVHDTAAYVFA